VILIVIRILIVILILLLIVILIVMFILINYSDRLRMIRQSQWSGSKFKQ